MKIGIVLNPYGEDKPAGLGRSIYEYTKAILKNDHTNEYIIILRKKPRVLPQFAGSNWRIKIADHKYFWLDAALWGENLDICIFSTPVISLFVKPKKTVVITYDYAYEDFGPKKFLKLYHGFSLRMADHIIAISNETKKETVRLFAIAEDKISVVYLGFNDICINAPVEVPNLPDKFFLFVGVIKARKNVMGVVQAFGMAKKESQFAHKLVIAGSGKGEYYENIVKYIQENNLTNEIIFLNHVNDGQLSFIYKKAEALIFPSFVEGFGMPVLEAMGCGIPVITSNASSLPEVAGDAGILVDPKDETQISKAIIELSKNETLRQSLIAKGRERIKRFTWNERGAEILKMINDL